MPTVTTKKSDKNELQALGFAEARDSYDLVYLPSQGKYGTVYGESIKVSHLKAIDSNILTSVRLMSEGLHLTTLVDKKLAYEDTKIKANDLLVGDFIKVLLFLRTTSGYGDEFIVKLTDPKTGEVFDHSVDLSSIKIKDVEVYPNEDGLLEYTLPHSKKPVLFRYLTIGEEREIAERDQKTMQLRNTTISNIETLRLVAQIQSLDGETDKSKIQTFIETQMSMRDMVEFKKFVVANEPSVDLEIEARGPSGATFQTDFPIEGLLYFNNV